MSISDWQYRANFMFWVLPIVLFETTWVIHLHMRAIARYGLFTHRAPGLRARQRGLALLGLYWCAVALWVEHYLEVDPSYQPFCDFAGWAKCSLVLMSPYGRILKYSGIASAGGYLDVPNPVLGIFFYLCHLFYPQLHAIPLPSFVPSISRLGTLCSVSCFLILAFFCVPPPASNIVPIWYVPCMYVCRSCGHHVCGILFHLFGVHLIFRVGRLLYRLRVHVCVQLLATICDDTNICGERRR